MNLKNELSEGTEKWVEYDSAQLLTNEHKTILMLRIGLARNALQTQLTFAEQGTDIKKHSAAQLRNLIFSQVSVAAFTFEAVKLAHGGFKTLRDLVELSADSESRPRVDDVIRRVGALCAGKDPASEFLVRARNELGFHWDEGPIRDALKQIVSGRSRGILVEFDHKGRPVYRLATDVLARALFQTDAADDEAKKVEQTQRDLFAAVELLREFFERALLGYVNQLDAPTS